MRGTDVTLLQKLLTAASGWRTTAQSQGVAVFQVNATMPDGKAVVLLWDADANDWLVTT